jgi:hypothetical protein
VTADSADLGAACGVVASDGVALRAPTADGAAIGKAYGGRPCGPGTVCGFPPLAIPGPAEAAAVEGAEGALLPERLARVVPAEFAESATLAGPGATDAMVTSASDIAGINTGAGLAQRLTLLDSSGNLIPGARAIIEFDTPAEGLASPVFRSNPGFMGGGQTAGGASEYVLPNLPLNQLQNVTIRIVPP